ncbi:MAG: phosphoribosyltransferase family protein [Clostridia bacterium]|nr:phosphoribosyltransferase family protein [Clostridia bacterium]
MDRVLQVNIAGVTAELPIIPLPSGISIAFFNLHGAQKLTEHCAQALAPLVADCDCLFTPESKALQLTHCIARILGHDYYAVARKTKKLYMQDGIEQIINSSITTGQVQKLYVSRHDVELMKGKRVAIIDDVVSTGNSLAGCEELVRKAGGIIVKKVFVLAEGDAVNRDDIEFLASIPILKSE